MGGWLVEKRYDRKESGRGLTNREIYNYFKDCSIDEGKPQIGGCYSKTLANRRVYGRFEGGGKR